jgi:hypothetical protein
MSVVKIAGSFRLSRIIPTMPNTNEAGKQKITSTAASDARGLPQPGPQRKTATNIKQAIISRLDDILP